MIRTRARAAVAAATMLAAATVTATVLDGGPAGAAGSRVSRSVTPAETWVTVPNVINMSKPDAVAELTLLGFRIQSTVEYTAVDCRSPVPPPDVLEQSPEAGNLVIRGATISLGLVSYQRIPGEC